MKKIFIASCCAVAIAGCCSSKNAGIAKMVLDDVRNDTIVVNVSDLNLRNVEWKDTICVENGSFTYQLSDNENARNVTFACGGQQISIMMLPGEHAELEGTFADYTVSGSKFYQDMNNYKEAMAAIDGEFAPRRAELAAKKDTEDAAILKKLEKELYDEWMEKHWQGVIDFIKANPYSDYSYYVASCLPERREEALAPIPDKVKEGPFKVYGAAMDEIFKKRDEYRKAIAKAAENIQPGKPAPDFTLDDLNGKPLSLSSLKGKYIVLDFWGSWCGWCIKGIPQMKEYYKKYSGKFEILGIACGDTVEKWKKAVEDNTLPWLNVINDEEGGTDISNTYAVTGYPTKIVIDPDGNIAKIITGESPEFYEYLDKLFK